MNRKEQIHSRCLEVVRERLHLIRDALKDAREGANEETKSSAGDKYETGRAMMQLESEKLYEQLGQAQQDELKLIRINPKISCDAVMEGALVETDQMNLYFALSVGKIALDGQEYMSLSTNSPLGEVSLGHKAGESFSFRGKTFHILNIK